MNKMTKKKNKSGKISKKMSFAEIIEKDPEIGEMLMQKGMHCIGCPMAMSETLEQGAIAHGINPDEIVDDINLKSKKLQKK